MWMADQRGVRRVWLALIQQGFQPTGGSIEKERFDSVGHIILLPQRTQRNTEEDSGKQLYSQCAGFLRQNVSSENLPHPLLHRITRQGLLHFKRIYSASLATAFRTVRRYQPCHSARNKHQTSLWQESDRQYSHRQPRCLRLW